MDQNLFVPLIDICNLEHDPQVNEKLAAEAKKFVRVKKLRDVWPQELGELINSPKSLFGPSTYNTRFWDPQTY